VPDRPDLGEFASRADSDTTHRTDDADESWIGE